MDAWQIPQVVKFFELVVNPIIRLIFALAIVYFVYGVFNYFIGDKGGDDRITGKNHILWSIIGLFIMISVWGIIAFLQKSILGI